MHIVFANARHRQNSLDLVLIAQTEGSANLYAQHLGGLFGEDHACTVKGNRLTGEPIPEGVEPGQRGRVIGDHHAQIGGAGGLEALTRLGVHRQMVGDAALIGQNGGDLSVVHIITLMFQRQGQIVILQLGELNLHDVTDGIPQTEACHQKRGTSGDADNRHKEALFVAEQVAGGHLVGEFHAAPQRADALQQDAFACRGCFGPHQGCGVVLQNALEGAHCRQKYRQQDQTCRKQDIQPVVSTLDGRQIIHQGIGLCDDPGEQGQEDRKAYRRTGHAGQRSVQQIFACDSGVGITQRLQSADGTPVFVDHTGHRSGSHQCRHQKEENGEDLCDGRHLQGVTFVENIAFVAFTAGKDVPFGGINIVDLILCIPDFHIGIIDFFVKLQLAVFIFLPAVVQFDSGVGQFRFGIGDLGFGIGQLLQTVVVLCPAVLQVGCAIVIFLPAVVQLDSGIGKLLPAFFQFFPGQLQLVDTPLVVSFGLPQFFCAGFVIRPALGKLQSAGVQCVLAVGKLLLSGVQLGLLLIQILLSGGDFCLGSLIIGLSDHAVVITLIQQSLLTVQQLFAVVQLCLSVLQLFLRRFQLCPTGIQILLSGLQRVECFFQLPFGILNLHISIVQLFLSVGDLDFGIGDLLQAVGIFPLAVLQLDEGVSQLLLTVLQVDKGICQLLSAVLQLLLAVGKLDQTVGIFLLAILQFLQRIGQFLLALGSFVSQLLLGFVQLLLRVGTQPVGADVLLIFCHIFHCLLDGGRPDPRKPG